MMVGSHDKLQSETGYIDARPHPPNRENLLHRTAGPYKGVRMRRPQFEQNESASPLKSRRASGECFAPLWADFVAKLESCRATNFSQKDGTGSNRRFV